MVTANSLLSKKMATSLQLSSTWILMYLFDGAAVRHQNKWLNDFREFQYLARAPYDRVNSLGDDYSCTALTVAKYWHPQLVLSDLTVASRRCGGSFHDLLVFQVSRNRGQRELTILKDNRDVVFIDVDINAFIQWGCSWASDQMARW